MSKDRFYVVDTVNGRRYVVNIDYVIAMQDYADPSDPGQRILIVADGNSEGGRMLLKLSPEEAEGVREWLYRQ
ncbi:hypothetical protein [Ectopseudomonas alcaliphila]|uniref:DUF1292 domain-containing protein n=1 Tax=Ectopseudomonas alcaliphila TaxID=101564 RepID=A0A1G7HDH7_9GAMM|nr:hypothetical protein [Pseudomonas alcaliphila]MDX5993778.1 hypothetical protein [Pseudomonas alcaliphila]SDE98373.1 hypothetical protein SAMN05216575_10558 [Pseudomonas alcaliphila]